MEKSIKEDILFFRVIMFLRIIVFFFVVYLVSCETDRKHREEDPPLQEALNTKYSAHVRAGKRVSLFVS